MKYINQTEIKLNTMKNKTKNLKLEEKDAHQPWIYLDSVFVKMNQAMTALTFEGGQIYASATTQILNSAKKNNQQKCKKSFILLIEEWIMNGDLYGSFYIDRDLQKLLYRSQEVVATIEDGAHGLS